MDWKCGREAGKESRDCEASMWKGTEGTDITGVLSMHLDL